MIIKNKKNQFELVSTFKTAPNIGIIKYWGKWHEQEIIPLNDNVGITLCQDDIYTLTSVKLTNKIDQNILIINGKEEQISQRIDKILKIFMDNLPHIANRKINEFRNTQSKDQQILKLAEIIDFNNIKVQIKSENSFPTASGLASSSSGLSALALCLTEFVGDNQIDVRYLSRIGSGSSCRCLYGNFVLWPGVQFKNVHKQSTQEVIDLESKRCLAEEIKSSAWLADCLNILIFVDKQTQKKEVSSTDGMQRTWQTSELFKARIEKFVPTHINSLMNAFEQQGQGFNQIMNIVIQDSNQFHATCQDTCPPIFYLNEFSKQIIGLIQSFNDLVVLKVGYTFDAGSHAVVLIHNDTLPQFVKFICEIYDTKKIELNDRLKILIPQLSQVLTDDILVQQLKSQSLQSPSQLILTRLGNGPQNVLK